MRGGVIVGKKTIIVLIFIILLFTACSKQVEIDTSSTNMNSENMEEKSNVENSSDAMNEKKMIFDSMPENYSYEITTTANDMTITFKYYKQGDSYRMEMQDPNTRKKTITIVNREENAMYIYMPEQNMATKTEISEDNGMMMGLFDMSMLSLDEEILNEAENIEEIDYNGEKVYYIEVSSPMTEGVKSKMWISKKYSLPVKMENEIDGKIVYTTTISNIKEGPFEKELFQIPKGVTINNY